MIADSTATKCDTTRFHGNKMRRYNCGHKGAFLYMGFGTLGNDIKHVSGFSNNTSDEYQL